MIMHHDKHRILWTTSLQIRICIHLESLQIFIYGIFCLISGLPLILWSSRMRKTFSISRLGSTRERSRISTEIVCYWCEWRHSWRRSCYGKFPKRAMTYFLPDSRCLNWLILTRNFDLSSRSYSFSSLNSCIPYNVHLLNLHVIHFQWLSWRISVPYY